MSHDLTTSAHLPHPIASSPPPFGVIFQDGWTPLHIAALKGYEAIVTLLLEAGADTKAKDKVRDERGGGGGVRVTVVCVCRCDIR